MMSIACGEKCEGALDVTPLLGAAPAGEWRTLKIRLDCFRKVGANMARVVEPFALRTARPLELSIAEVRLVADPTGAVCPAR